MVYYGKDGDIEVDLDADVAKRIGKSGKIVVSLLGDLAGEGRHIVTDSWYTSQKLSEYLLTVNTTLTGTIKKNRGVPQKLKKMELERDQSAFMRKGDHLICKYQDKGEVHCLTFWFSADLVDGKRFVPGRGWLHYKKPRLIDSYNQIMGGVDKADQLLKYYRYDRRSLAWFKKLALHFIQRMCLNICHMEESAYCQTHGIFGIPEGSY